MTAGEREKIETLAKDFTAIMANKEGKILYLGTPQSKDSLYNNLPARGYEVRIWTGRVPRKEDIDSYGDKLAPFVLNMIKNGAAQDGYGVYGTLGEQTDPERYTEKQQEDNELDYGAEGYELQYMLNTRLSDEKRTRIKLGDFIIADFGHKSAPYQIGYTASPQFIVDTKHPCIFKEKMYCASSVSDEVADYTKKIFYIDPAGAGGDEVSFAILGVLNGYIHILGMGGLQGGMTDENMHKFARLLTEFEVNHVILEKNMGHGTATSLFNSFLINNGYKGILVEDEYVSGQKEKRIIDTISPYTRRHRVVLHQKAIDMDYEYCSSYPQEKRKIFSGLRQLGDITYDRGSLKHDDRADCIAGGVIYLNKFIVVDENKEQTRIENKKFQEFLNNPMGYPSHVLGNKKSKRSTRRSKRFI